LILSINNNAPITSFPYKFSGTGLEVVNISVYWYGSTLPNQKWYTAVKNKVNVSNTASGCGGGFNNTSGVIAYNTDRCYGIYKLLCRQ